MTEEFKPTSIYEQEDAQRRLCKIYHEIIELAKEYIDTTESNYRLIALWIIGTYVHEDFNTFPFLFINAMRGSGKTRLLKFISTLAKNGDIVADIKEAVLFRTAKDHTIIIDEFEHIGGKDKGVLRELLNAAYKRGIKVKRMRKTSEKGQEKQVVEEFDLYTPIAMANIWGMDEVLGDRCLTIILEKSNNNTITRMAEDFEFNVRFNRITREMVSLCRVVTQKTNQQALISSWNYFIKHNDTTTLTTLTTPNDTTTHNNNIQNNIFKKIYDTGIDGRNFELMFPLFILAGKLGDNILDEFLEIAKDIIKNKREDEFAESKDVSLIDFVSHQIQWNMEMVSLKTITTKFREFLGEQEDEDRWLNEKWLGKALKRLSLILQKHRKNNGREFMLDIAKAKENIKMFRTVE